MPSSPTSPFKKFNPFARSAQPESNSDSDEGASASFNPGAAGVGLSDPDLAKDSRALLDLVNRLHDTGISIEAEIDLPQIAVIGCQSAGKSSLIESISGITLPRAAGTCTRCPIECRLSRSPFPWQCKVSLHRHPTPGESGTRDLCTQFGDIITDKSQVEDRVSRAQRAILTPTRPAEEFLRSGVLQLSDEDRLHHGLGFSKDWVSLEISGPDVADLSFIDLPGIITGGWQDDIDLIQELVTSYIEKPSCVILLTVTCETDFLNQSAHKLAQELDPTGCRTIGVLTKPDRIALGDEQSWLSRFHPGHDRMDDTVDFPNNWFCVKQPSTNELSKGMTWEKSRRAEKLFFSTKKPWSLLKGEPRERLGTKNLVRKLSEILSNLIKERLPDIRRQISSQIEKAEEELDALGNPPSENPFAEVSFRINKFYEDLSRVLKGDPADNKLNREIRPLQSEFMKAIRSTAPNFKPFERRYAGEKVLGRMDFLAEEEGEEVEVETGEEEEGREVFERPEGGSRQRSSTGKRRAGPTPESGTRSSGASGPWVKRRKIMPDSNAIYVDDVMELAEGARTQELPGMFPFYLYGMFFEKFKTQWAEPAGDFSNKVHRVLLQHVLLLVHEKLGAFGSGRLAGDVSRILTSHMKANKRAADDALAVLLRREEQPLTIHNTFFLNYQRKFLSFYEGAAAVAFGNDPNFRDDNSDFPRGVPPVRETHGQTDTAAPSSSRNPGNTMAPALLIMAHVRAYFQVAYRRYSDSVVIALNDELVKSVQRDVYEVLFRGLGFDKPDVHTTWLRYTKERDEVAKKRAELKRRLGVLEKANEELDC